MAEYQRPRIKNSLSVLYMAQYHMTVVFKSPMMQHWGLGSETLPPLLWTWRSTWEQISRRKQQTGVSKLESLLKKAVELLPVMIQKSFEVGWALSVSQGLHVLKRCHFCYSIALDRHTMPKTSLRAKKGPGMIMFLYSSFSMVSRAAPIREASLGLLATTRASRVEHVGIWIWYSRVRCKRDSRCNYTQESLSPLLRQLTKSKMGVLFMNISLKKAKRWEFE